MLFDEDDDLPWWGEGHQEIPGGAGDAVSRCGWLHGYVWFVKHYEVYTSGPGPSAHIRYSLVKVKNDTLSS